ncbi:phosphatidylserine/phosphatidylglycerophosphate/cardiolipin synthase family protein [Rahnella sp. SAP-1]|uniref:Phosphatidylserine/phosphatidylglycerophosphate/ cardiolipin synthase family protein n=1 Tax=Rouxiella aceris TaxID=2703884 RepID=A0A848MI57_9GAMM|nr:phospholipase D-like domain-containing protein [Rouxiella aceris]NMP26819.1 phosphatidylserine/phosphatidylglycerophosphate/cardiolipin synthase family protein [Rouxiella aceris]
MTTLTPQICNAVPGKTNSIIMTPQWFPENTEYPPCQAAYAPLINGEKTFAVLARAIQQAQKSIDIITWGFQASMYFERNGQGKMVGELLEEAANRGVTVRILVWFSITGQLPEANFPGWGAYFPDNSNSFKLRPVRKEEAFLRDKKRLNENKLVLLATGEKLSFQTRKQYEFDKYWHFRAENNDIKNLSIRHRELSWKTDSVPVISRIAALPYSIKDDSSILRNMALSFGATHHQKMVLVDYIDPDKAVGFIMGHNMLSQYWDTDKHSSLMQSCDRGRDGPTGWQDISSCVYGEVLKHMSDNFTQAWEKDTNDSTPKRERVSINKEAFSPTPPRLQDINQRLLLPMPLTRVMGQICRTQPQYNAWDILKAYIESVKRARNYIYIENQYFRFQKIAEQLKKTALELILSGRDPEKHGYLYLFVVTNSTEKPEDPSWTSNEAGGYQTYKMLDCLGRADLMPNYAKKEKGVTEEIKPQQIPGLKSIICTLVSPDSKAEKWMPVYVHSKMMMVDDIFMIQGSANINLRSMAFDSEIAIALQDTDSSSIIATMRNQLWSLHTNGEGFSGDITNIYNNWERLIKNNSKKGRDNMQPMAPLIEFIDNSKYLSHKD